MEKLRNTVNNITTHFFSKQSEDAVQTNSQETKKESDTGESESLDMVSSYLQFPLVPAYAFDKKQKFRLEESVLVTAKMNFVTVRVDTPFDTQIFKLRTNKFQYNSDILQAEYISMNAYSFDVYYRLGQKYDCEFLHRRVFYSTDGLGSESYRETNREPASPVWSQEEHNDSTVSVTNTYSDITVSDWRSSRDCEGSVMITFQDSLRKSNGRDGIKTKITVDDLQHPLLETCNINQIGYDMEDQFLYFYTGETNSVKENIWMKVRLSEPLKATNMSWNVGNLEQSIVTKDEFIWIWSRTIRNTWSVFQRP